MFDPYEYAREDSMDEFRILKSLVTEKGMTTEAAVQQILALTRACETRSLQLGNHCCAVAGALLWTASRTAPDAQHKLVAFFHRLRSETITDLLTGEALEYDREAVWKDLPTFGYTFADELHSIPSPYPTPAKVTHWLNVLSFTAQLDASTRDDPTIDFTHTWALISIMRVLNKDDSGTLERFGGVEVAVKMACVWFIHDSEKLWSKVPETKNFTLTNWQTWKRGIKERRDESENWQVKMWCERALAEIRRVESE